MYYHASDSLELNSVRLKAPRRSGSISVSRARGRSLFTTGALESNGTALSLGSGNSKRSRDRKRLCIRIFFVDPKLDTKIIPKFRVQFNLIGRGQARPRGSWA